MKLGLLVNSLEGEKDAYATTAIARTAVQRDHQVYYIGIEDFAHDPDDLLRARATRAPAEAGDAKAFLKAIRSGEDGRERIDLPDLDVLFLRNNPAEEIEDRPWAQSVGIVFGQLAVRAGVIVLNDPFGLSQALNKLYFQTFPAEIRPKTLITRDREEIRSFFREHAGSVVLKPLRGSGGDSVFLIREGDQANLNQMFDAVARDGYVVAQEYLPDAGEGDLRLFLLNGRPLRREGKYAAMFRRAAQGDLRSNIHAGGSSEPAEVDDRALRIAELVRPKLVEDGMFLVGLDVAGEKLLEVNVFSPGGLPRMGEFEGVDFAAPVVEALERKVEYVRHYGPGFRNRDLALL